MDTLFDYFYKRLKNGDIFQIAGRKLEGNDVVMQPNREMMPRVPKRYTVGEAVSDNDVHSPGPIAIPYLSAWNKVSRQLCQSVKVSLRGHALKQGGFRWDNFALSARDDTRIGVNLLGNERDRAKLLRHVARDRPLADSSVAATEILLQ